MKLDNDPLPIKVIEFDKKKVLIRSDQTESTKGKNVLVDNNAAPRMIKPKISEVGAWKANGKKRKAPKIKPTISMLLEKYTSCKGSNMFNRLGGVKCPRSPSGSCGHERWSRNLYDQQPYYLTELAY